MYMTKDSILEINKSFREWAKDTNISSKKTDINMANKYMKIYL